MATRWPEQGGVMPIDVGGIVHEHNRPAEAQKDISGWFTTEELTIDFGEDEGRPSGAFTIKREYIVQFLQNGWKPKPITSYTEGGNWNKKTETDNTHIQMQTGVSSSHSEGSSSSSMSWTPVLTNSEVNEQGDPYWYASKTITLVRRRMQPENVLNDIIKTYVNQYNAGIANEDARFNEVVQLYAVMLNRSETEGNKIIDDAKEMGAARFFRTLYDKIDNTWDWAKGLARDLATYVEQGSDIEVRYKFQALIAKTKSQMIGQGTYNGTVWPTVEAGILRQMEAAIAEAKKSGFEISSQQMTALLGKQGDVAQQLLNAYNAIIKANDERGFTVTELRNTVLKGMLDFIGKREDVYPQIQDISQAASQLGFSIGASGNAV